MVLSNVGFLECNAIRWKNWVLFCYLWRRWDRLRSIQGNKAHSLLVPGVGRKQAFRIFNAARKTANCLRREGVSGLFCQLAGSGRNSMAHDPTAGRMQR